MNRIEFCKFHGFGNDYIVFEAEKLRVVSASVHDFAVRVCDRNRGVGADGIAVLEKLTGETADFSCRIINPDGGEAGFSGNGTRCAVAYLYFKKLWTEHGLKLLTKSGLKTYELLEKNETAFRFVAELGKPEFNLPDSAMKPPNNAALTNLMFPGEGVVLPFAFVDVGNPVAVISVKDFNEIDWRKFGGIIEKHELFPERTNVVFVKTIDAENIEIRIWERGAGETASSGTCSIAAAVTHLKHENRCGKVAVHAPGGTTETEWRAKDDEMLITGSADLAFCGEWFES